MDPHYNDIPVPETWDKVLSLIPIFSGLLSVWGSANIIHMVRTSPTTTPYRRILFGLSCSDLVCSLALPFHSFLVPADTSPRIWAIGNGASCTAMGFFHQLNFANVWYSGMLSFYFLLTVKFGIRQEDFARRYEPWMHVSSVGYPLITASIGAGLGVYDELSLGAGCWVTNYPKGCGCKEEGEEDNACCLSPLIGWIFGGLPGFLVIVAIIVNNLMVFCHVRYTIRRSQRYSSVTRSNNSRTSTQSFFSGVRRSSDQRESDAQDRRIRAVATQSFLYVAAFSLAITPGFVLRLLETNNFHDESKLIPVVLAQCLFMPLQGFLNCLVYARPAYVRARKTFPDQSRFWCFRRALHGDKVIPKPIHQRDNRTRDSYSNRTARPTNPCEDSTSRAIHQSDLVETNALGNISDESATNPPPPDAEPSLADHDYGEEIPPNSTVIASKHTFMVEPPCDDDGQSVHHAVNNSNLPSNSPPEPPAVEPSFAEDSDNEHPSNNSDFVLEEERESVGVSSRDSPTGTCSVEQRRGDDGTGSFDQASAIDQKDLPVTTPTPYATDNTSGANPTGSSSPGDDGSASFYSCDSSDTDEVSDIKPNTCAAPSGGNPTSTATPAMEASKNDRDLNTHENRGTGPSTTTPPFEDSWVDDGGSDIDHDQPGTRDDSRLSVVDPRVAAFDYSMDHPYSYHTV